MNNKKNLLTLKAFNELYSVKVVSLKRALLKDNLMELDYSGEEGRSSYQIIENETQEIVFEFTTDNDEKFIRALMEKFKIKELELFYMCD